MPDSSEVFNVAVLEDDAALRQMWQWVLEDEGYCVSSFSTPDQLLDALSSGDRPNLLLLDLGLPPSPDTSDEGMKVLERLVEERPDMKVIVLTGQNQ